MANLTYEKLRRATAGQAVAMRSTTILQPAGGPGDKVFPPSYAVGNRAEHRYAVEEHHTDTGIVTTVLLDSVASQANRAELALLTGWEAKELVFPVAYVDFTVDDTASEAPDGSWEKLLSSLTFRRADGREVSLEE